MPTSLEIARRAVSLGLEALGPIARWKGFGGSTNFNGKAYQKYASLCLIAADTAVVGDDKTLLRRFSQVYTWASASKRDQAMHAKGHPSSVQSTAVRFEAEGQAYWRGKRQ